MPERPPRFEQPQEEEEYEEREPTEMERWKTERVMAADNGRRAMWLFWAPEHIENYLEAKHYLFWMPTKRDIEKILAVAIAVHENKPGPIRVLDIGGAGGFLDKLLIDAAREKGIDIDCTVIDPAKEVLKEARQYYASKGESQLHFVDGKVPEHLELKRERFDVVLNSWMWGDLRDEIQSIPSLARVYIADRLGATGYGVDDHEIENSYTPESGFQDFGSWPAIDHVSIKEEGYADDYTTTQVLIQLRDEVVARFGEEIGKELKEIDEKIEGEFRIYPWEESLRRARDRYLETPIAVWPGESRRERKHRRAREELNRKRAKEGRDKKWWKFRRGGDWRYVPVEER